MKQINEGVETLIISLKPPDLGRVRSASPPCALFHKLKYDLYELLVVLAIFAIRSAYSGGWPLGLATTTWPLCFRTCPIAFSEFRFDLIRHIEKFNHDQGKV